MMFDARELVDPDRFAGATPDRAPGKSTLTSRLAPRADAGVFIAPVARSPAPAAAISDDPFALHLSSAGALPEGDPGAIFAAATGAGDGVEVPYRAEMERAFGEDFSDVRAYRGRDQAMHALGAHAAARGDTVAFAGTSPSRALVAHELTHTVQARRGDAPTVAGKAVSSPDDPAEREADEVAARVVAGERVQVGTAGRSACGCAGAGCPACGKAAPPDVDGPVQRAAASPSADRAGTAAPGTAAAPTTHAAVERAIALLSGPAQAVAQRTGSPQAAAERSSVISKALAALARIARAPATDTAPPLEPAVDALQVGLARGAAELDRARPDEEAERDPGHAPTPGDRAPASAGATVQRSAARGRPPFDCDPVLAEIKRFVAELIKRSAELIADKHGLQWNHWFTRHPIFGSVEGHRQQFRDWQRGLQKNLEKWNDNDCDGTLPPDTWEWTRAPAPVPTPRPNPDVQRTAELVGEGALLGVGLYAAYRIVRMIPSLFPPLWWTIPANAAVP